MWLERLSGGAQPLITLADAKDKLRIISPAGEDPELDNEISRAIAAATAALDVDPDGFGGLGFPLVSQRWVRKGANFGDRFLKLPFVRITSIEAVRYHALGGGEEVISSQHYVMAGRGRARQLAPVGGFTWPSVEERPDAVSLEFTAGYATVEAVPEDLKAAVRELVKFYYDHPLADAAIGVPEQVQRGVDRLTSRYRAFAL